MVKHAWFGICVAVLAVGLASCSKSSDKATTDISQRTIRVVTTIGMITDLAENIGGDRVQVTGLMGPGIDPHLYKASAGDVERLSQADLILYNGLHLESKMGEVLEQMGGQIKTQAVASEISEEHLLTPPEFQGAHDPHIWFDVMLWMKATEKVRDTLAEFDPTHADQYRQNAARYLEELQQLHEYVKNQAAMVPEDKRVLVTAHDAFNYFGHAYGFEVRGLQGISTASEAGTGDVQALAQFIADSKIPAIFVESSVPQRNIEAVQAAVKSRGFAVQIGGELFSDAMGNKGTPEGTYVGMVKHNINTIVTGLSGS